MVIVVEVGVTVVLASARRAPPAPVQVTVAVTELAPVLNIKPDGTFRIMVPVPMEPLALS
jgi:hypothetical protein